MAGDWIKIEENMPDKPEVYGIAKDIGIEPDAVCGKLIRVWSWASRNCPVSGRTDVRSLSAIDRVAFHQGFAQAMSKAGWLIIEGDSVTFPNFDYHCSQTAKERALDQKRKKNKRIEIPDSVRKLSAPRLDLNRTKAGPEKRREEKSIIQSEGAVAPDELPLTEPFPPELENPAFHAAWDEWTAYRKERKLAAYKPITIRAQLAKLSEIGCANAIEAIRNSIRQNYQGIFQEKTHGGPCNERKMTFA